jgi:catechol 2,3-dioxygenase-like lactoylglutathione lyase family enzyme
MTPLARLAAISLDTDDPAALAAFYKELLGLDDYFASEDFVALKGGPVLLTFQRVAEHLTPTWPAGSVPKQMHLELAVTDLGASEAAAVALGATRAEGQPAPDKWIVLLDPSGHPFCITTLIPEP